MNNAMFLAAFMCLGAYLGNWAGDQKTIQDCAVRGEARMLGGGSINCQVQKANP